MAGFIYLTTRCRLSRKAGAGFIYDISRSFEALASEKANLDVFEILFITSAQPLN
jgi:hypothetical protein